MGENNNSVSIQSTSTSSSPSNNITNSTQSSNSCPSNNSINNNNILIANGSAEYLAQLLKDKKQLAAFPNIFLHIQRLIDEGMQSLI